MEIKAADVGKLRKMTGAGMMDCKKALVEANGDFDRAQEIIREKGKLIASKRADRTATEGVVVGRIIGTKGYMLCLACETDFVAINEGFAATAESIMEVAIANDCVDMEALLACTLGDVTIADAITEKSGQTGEKVELPFYARVEAAMCHCYVHTNKKLGTLIGFNAEVSETLAHDVAMQATAMAPIAIDKEDCPADLVDKERQIGREQARLDGKPEAMLDKIAEGKLNKFFADATLLNQPFVKNNKQTIRQYIQSEVKDATVVAFKRFSLSD